jgi:DNA topoisomerase-2
MANSLRTVKDFFDKEYRDYALYVVENRAIPSVIDGLKPSQRKIIHAANMIWKTGKEKPQKLFQLAGGVAAKTFYHHGNASLEAALVNISQDFKNSMPLLEGIGQFGSLRSPSAGAPRYIGARLHPNFRLLYKDFEILTPQYEEGEEIEPRFFLPIIPTVLLNGSSGIAVGFSTNILNRNPRELIKACKVVLNGKGRMPKLTPWLKDFKGEWKRLEEDPNRSSYVAKGVYKVVNTTTVHITEIPPSHTYEKYETHLNSLIDKRILVSYEDNCSDSIDYVLKFPRAILTDLQEKEKLDSLLKMEQRETENLTTIDEHGKLKIFKLPEEIIHYFVDFRLGYYQKRKDYLIEKIERELLILSNRARFIKLIIEGKIKINKVPRVEIESQLEKLSFDKVDGTFGYLLSMPIYNLTLEKYNELVEAERQKKEELKNTKSLDTKEMYISDLDELDKALSRDY